MPRCLRLATLMVFLPSAALAQSYVRFINATPAELQAITVSIDGGDARELEYGRSTQRITVAEGSRTLKAVTTGPSPVTLVERAITLTKDKYYSVVVTGQLFPGAYDIVVAEDDDTDPQGHLRVRYGLMAKGVLVSQAMQTPDLHIVCDGVKDIRVSSQALKFSSYVDVQVPAGWTGGLCRVTLEVSQNSVWVPIWQDLSNYFFSPHSIYTVVSIGLDPATLVLLRETDNK